MPPRKYPSERKTTSPEGYREYKKLQMRDVRKHQREEIKAIVDSKIKEFPEVDREAARHLLTAVLSTIYVKIDREEEEAEQYIKLRIDSFYASLLQTVKNRIELQKMKETQH
jgi:hypothetical protein